MSCDGVNIYKRAREMAGLTQEGAIEHFKTIKSLRTLQRYESGEAIPKSLTVKEMVKIYKAKWMGYMHLQKNDDLGKEVLQKLNLDDLSISVLKFQKEYRDIPDIEDSMIEIACDGNVDEHEEDGWRRVTKEIDELMSAGLSLMYAQNKKISPLTRGI